MTVGIREQEVAEKDLPTDWQVACIRRETSALLRLVSLTHITALATAGNAYNHQD